MRRFFQLALRWDAPFRVSSAGFLHAASHNRHHALPSASSLLGQRCFTTSRVARSALDGDSTIYALSTAPGRAAIAVVRVSGPACVQIYKALCPETPLPKPRVAALRALYDPTQSPSPDSLVDAGALVLFFPAPKTVTGEDVLELHLHGGPAIVKSVLGAIAQVGKQGVLSSTNLSASASASPSTSPIRYAEPGEFTRRAFMNDHLDLPQIEALGQTLSADTEQQRRLAVRGSSTTALSDRYEEWRRMLLYARGEMEALIDFSEDQHFDESSDELVGSVAMQVRALRRQVHAHIRNASRGELMRNGIRVALLGRPNAGKSSLLNLVVGKEAAIVSTEAGTTRDIVDVGVDLGGWFCRFGDMAGIRGEASGGKGEGEEEVSVVVGAVEKEGIRRAKARALESDVVLVILSIERGDDGGDGDGGWTLSVEREVLDATRDCIEAGKCVLVAVNKCDRLDSARGRPSQSPNALTATVRAMLPTIPEDRVFAISCREAQEGISPDPDHDRDDPGNIQGLLRGFISTFEQMSSPIGIEGEDGDGDGDGESGQFDSNYWEDSLGVTHRQSSNLQRCLDHLDEFLEQAAPSLAPPAAVPRQPERDGSFGVPHGDAAAAFDGVESEVDIVTAAEHLRFAADALAMITGRGESGDVEDVLGVIFEKLDMFDELESSLLVNARLSTNWQSVALMPSRALPVLLFYFLSALVPLYPPRPMVMSSTALMNRVYSMNSNRGLILDIYVD